MCIWYKEAIEFIIVYIQSLNFGKFSVYGTAEIKRLILYYYLLYSPVPLRNKVARNDNNSKKNCVSLGVGTKMNVILQFIVEICFMKKF